MADHDQNPSSVAEPRAASQADPENTGGRKNSTKKKKGASKGSSKPRKNMVQVKPKPGKHGKQYHDSNNRFTHPVVVSAVEDSFRPIDFDPCWHEASAVRPVAYLDIRKGQDGLRDPWQGPLAFMNPPWSAAKKFLERSYDQWKKGNVKTVICLIPSNTDTAFFHTILKAEADVYFVKGRMRFFKEDGSPYTSAQAVMIVIFGATEQERRASKRAFPARGGCRTRMGSAITVTPLGCVRLTTLTPAHRRAGLMVATVSCCATGSHPAPRLTRNGGRPVTATDRPPPRHDNLLIASRMCSTPTLA